MDFEILQLPKEKWKGTPILMNYTTKEYYDLEMSKDDQGFRVQMIKKKFDAPVTHSSEEYDFPDRLYQDHWAGAKAWGIVRKKEGNEEILAIAFYLSQGFELIGFDSCCYTNRDAERREVRFDFGFYMDQREGRW